MTSPHATSTGTALALQPGLATQAKQPDQSRVSPSPSPNVRATSSRYHIVVREPSTASRTKLSAISPEGRLPCERSLATVCREIRRQSPAIRAGEFVLTKRYASAVHVRSPRSFSIDRGRGETPARIRFPLPRSAAGEGQGGGKPCESRPAPSHPWQRAARGGRAAMHGSCQSKIEMSASQQASQGAPAQRPPFLASFRAQCG